MSDPTTIVIIGGGLAGASAAGQLVERGFDGHLVLVGDEHEFPYERPPLSKSYLSGDSEFDAALVHDEDWYRSHVDLRRGTRATALHPAAHTVALSDGSAVTYDSLLLTPGAIPRQLDVDGGERALTLRTRADADRLRTRLGAGVSVAVVGGGWIGLEVAAAARGAGADVTLVEAGPTPLAGVLGVEMGRVFADLQATNGVDVRTSATLESVTDDAVVVDGERIAADVVVAGIGVEPDVALAEDAGLDVNDGIVVDASLRTSAPDVYAAGDAAASYYPRYGRHVRVEHWANARHQASAAARAMLGDDVRYDRLPYFFTDQYDLGMEYVGWVPPERLDEARVVVRGDVDQLSFRAYWLLPEGGAFRTAAGMHVNMWDEGVDPLKAVVESGEPIDPESLR
jgi:3-phenylpropionate/trans-cinnamate dioxygenase ferredoxin reductase subunit